MVGPAVVCAVLRFVARLRAVRLRAVLLRAVRLVQSHQDQLGDLTERLKLRWTECRHHIALHGLVMLALGVQSQRAAGIRYAHDRTAIVLDAVVTNDKTALFHATQLV